MLTIETPPTASYLRSRALLTSSSWNTLKLYPDTYAHAVSGKAWVNFRHTKYIASRITVPWKAGDFRGRVHLPTGHGKTVFLCEWLPLWWLYLNPTSRGAVVAYGQDLANEIGDATKKLTEEFDTGHDWGNRTVTRLATRQGGSVTFGSRGGGLAGKHFDWIIITDLIKNADEWASDAHRDSIWNFLQWLPTRLLKHGNLLLEGARWPDDPAARLEAKHGEGYWNPISLPAEARPGDPLGRTVGPLPEWEGLAGEPLCPELRSVPQLVEAKLNPFFWACQQQQDPIPMEGNIVHDEWIRDWPRGADGEYLPAPPADLTGLSLDTATSENEANAATATIHFQMTGEDMYVHDAWEEWLEYTSICDITILRVNTLQPDLIFVEKKVTGVQLIPYLEERLQYGAVIGIMPGGAAGKPESVPGDKRVRMIGCTPFFAKGHFYVKRGTESGALLVRRLTTFPGAPRKDLCDATSQVICYFTLNGGRPGIS